MHFVAFDIETAREAPEDRSGGYDLGVTCASACVVSNGWQESSVWHGAEWFGAYCPQMTETEVDQFVGWLSDYATIGYRLVSWNGLGFDFRVLAEEVSASTRHIVEAYAIESVDPFYQMLCEKGYGIGLATAAEGLGLGGKMEGMDGLKAIEMWAGDLQDQGRVLEYVKRDARLTADVYATLVAAGKLRWISRSGRLNNWHPILKPIEDHQGVLNRMLTVEEATALPEPDTSWMTDPWRREDFYGWTGWAPPAEGGGHE